MNLLKKCGAEFIGAYAIVFGGCGAVAINQLSEGAITHVGIATSFWPLVIGPIFPLMYSAPFSAQPQARSFTNLSVATPNPAPMSKVVVKSDQ